MLSISRSRRPSTRVQLHTALRRATARIPNPGGVRTIWPFDKIKTIDPFAAQRRGFTAGPQRTTPMIIGGHAECHGGLRETSYCYPMPTPSNPGAKFCGTTLTPCNKVGPVGYRSRSNPLPTESASLNFSRVRPQARAPAVSRGGWAKLDVKNKW